MSNSQVFHWNTIVDFADTDAGGVVYYARYLEWAERARAALLRECNLSNQQLWQKGIVFVVTRAEIDFKQSGKLDDQIRVETTLSKLKGVRLTLQQNIYRQADQALLCSCLIILACIDSQTLKPTKIPPSVAKKFSDALPET